MEYTVPRKYILSPHSKDKGESFLQKKLKILKRTIEVTKKKSTAMLKPQEYPCFKAIKT
jgi:hypothetical protein